MHEEGQARGGGEGRGGEGGLKQVGVIQKAPAQ